MKCSLAIVMLAVFSSTGHAEEPLTPVVMKESLRIPNDQIPALKKSANEGDRNAAERLSLYYGVYLSDRKKELYYLKLGAENNSDVAVRNLMTIYSTDPKLFDFKKALGFRQQLKRIAETRKIDVQSDADWSYDLYIEHFAGYGNKRRGLFFLEYAAKHGSEKARDELIEIYSNDPDVRNPAKARHWKKARGANRGQSTNLDNNGSIRIETG